MVINIRDLDLNLLKILRAVVETRNTHTAADKLGISQTSVSRGLAKLREMFGEQLFIRKAHGVEPSELAEKLAETSEEMFNPLIKVVESYQNFEPMEFNGEIKIAMNIYFLELHGDGIFNTLRNEFPNANFKLVYWQEHSLAEVLSGDIDYLIHFEGYPLPQEIYCHTLEEVELCLVARMNHPILSQSSDWDSIHQLPLARVIIDGINSKRSPVEEIYLAKGYQPRVTLVTHSIRVLINKLSSSDAIMFGSRYMSILDNRLASYPLPELPKQMRYIQVCGGYLQSKRGYPLNQKLHQIIQEYFNNITHPTV
ncbi:LysR family transcriptional regulator [Vibrio parahaemolyticus]|uniref:LysR family transcriptional regulator n=1 Tax=Vibrio parahaemolyticus TaxID=670 RepID=UPI001375B173|nr:LysR family transcriptional regulator [Vibrio parahaemolyticus]MBM5283660.1 LysR family transcriptional regulator [Vibrio parahaemolyticus]MCF9091012.1 LysR family transcriptional regulator [Vibrio parahaemolyticus]MCF9100316.1 LysR family transcriptional regulator [Vibrio parahaemolyticus]NCN13453.1 LysR family transcriptional regulator [Vibrio parahaemolyticus]